MQQPDILRISLWDDARLRAFAQVLAEGPAVEVALASREDGEKRLLAGLQDLALVSADRVIASPDDFDILPAVAYSSWNTPHAQIALVDGLTGRPESVACTSVSALEALVTRVVLREHYGMSVQAVQADGPAKDSTEQAVLAVDEPPPPLGPERILDLGREWYELTNYPMVWGLFVMRKGEATADVVQRLRAAAASVETADHLDGTDDSDDGLALPRFRYDDIATASLTELCSYLYYYGVADDIRELLPVEFEEDEDEGEDDREPLL